MTVAFTIVPNTTRIINPSADEIARCEKQFLQNKERTTRFRESLASDPEKRSKRSKRKSAVKGKGPAPMQRMSVASKMIATTDHLFPSTLKGKTIQVSMILSFCMAWWINTVNLFFRPK